MKKFLLGLLCTMLLGITAIAEVEIPQEQRVKNYPSGCCVWCAIEDLANIHDIKELKGIAKYRHDNYSKVKTWINESYAINPWGIWVQVPGHWEYINQAPGTPEKVIEEFKRLKIKHYWVQPTYNYSTDILEEAVNKDLGCAVALENYPKFGDRHMVTLVDLTDKKFVFIDNLNKCERYEASRTWFDQHWMGFVVLIYPEKPTT